MTVAASILAAIAALNENAELMDAIVNGPADGPASLVTTTSGTVKTLARISAESTAFILTALETTVTVQNVGRSTVTATIANGASVSGVIDLGKAVLVGLQMPAAWTAANLTLLGSLDGVNYCDVKDRLGIEYQITATSSLVVPIAASELPLLRYLKLRSGTSAVPVNQGAARNIIVSAFG